MADRTESRFRKLYDVTQEFLTEKWIETHEESRSTRFQRVAHFWLLAIKSFSRNRCPSRATALAYTTLLALVPLLAVGVSITTGMLKEKGDETTRELISRFIDYAVPQLKLMPKTEEGGDARAQVISQIQEFIQNARSKTLGVTGVLGLIMVAILLLSTIEDTFNDIWGVTQGRTWFRRVVQYWTTISLGPVILAGAIVMVTSTHSQSSQAFLQQLPFVGVLLYKAIPFFLVSLAFALFYKLMPNTQVHWRSAFVGGIVGGTFWLLLNIFNALNVSRVLSMSTIYGSLLGIIPIFLIGLYFSWSIMLFGAQVAYAHQNRQVYVQEKKAESINQRGREYVALRVMTYMAELFDKGKKPATLLEVATALGVPSRLVGRVLKPLIDARLVLEVSSNEGEGSYTIARPLEHITCYDVLMTLRTGGGQDLQTREEESRAVVCDEFHRIQQAEQKVAGSVTLRDLVDRIAKAQPVDPLAQEARRIAFSS